MNKLKTLLKNNIFLYKIYRLVFNFLINFLKIFIRVDDKVILFNCFGGQKFDDSPKAIYDYIISNSKYDSYSLYWAFDNIDKYTLKKGEKIKNNSFKYFCTALKAKYWVTNSSMERGLKFKNKKTIYINTWHGTAIKKMGNDQLNKKCTFKDSKSDIFFAQGKYDVNVFSSAFDIPKEKIVISGFPRNDELACEISKKELQSIKLKLNIPIDKKVIIYMPTFREYDKDKSGNYIKPPIHIEKWKECLKNDYVLLFRAHYETTNVLGLKYDDFIYDVSTYEPLNELLKISDILVSDYSSVMFDFSILERPIFSFAYDYETYLEKRGSYIDMNKELPNGICKNEDELLEMIIKCNFDEQRKKTIEFKNKYVEEYGKASRYIDNIIK